ncbi:LAGLIDADG family homing endonuclease [Streptomyces populi]|uniref:LAGLIDADG family homing endonuclease n=1 Tax=Streptomyces populi TaxID=2058924 RepID=UPI0035DB94ED
MAGSFRIAEGYVEVTADESNYDRAMDRLKAKKNSVRIGVDLDDKDAKARLTALLKPRKVKLTAELDDKAATTGLTRLARDRTVKLTAHLDDAAVSSKLTVLSGQQTVDILPKISDAAYNAVKAKLDRLTKERSVAIRPSVDTRVAADELRNLTRRQRVRIGVDVDTRVAADDIANLTRRRQMTIQARADTAAANTALNHAARDRTANIRVRTFGLGALTNLGGAGGGGGGLGGLTSSLTSMTALAVQALPTVASLGQAMMQMGPAAAIAAPAVLSLGAAFAAIKVGTSGLGDAFKQAFAPATKSAGAAENSTRRVEAAQRSLAKAQQAVKDAEVAAAEARVRAARDIEDAQQSLKSTVQDVADANRRALESVESAERDLADAQRAAKQAQEDLNDAREQAAEDLQDLNNRLADAQLDQRQKVLDLQDAEQELAAVKAKGAKATAEELAKAQLQYDKAVQALSEQQTETERLQEQTDAANAAGVEGSKTVTDAKGKISDATQDVADKTKALADAEKEAARTQEDGAQRIAKAQRDVADAQAAAAKAATDGARQIKDAQEAAADAARALADAQTKTATATTTTVNAMAKLAPNAQAFVRAVIAQREAWRSLKLDVQNALFDGLGQKFTTMSAAILPSLRTGLTGTATVLNSMAKNAFDAVTNLGKAGTLRQMFDGLNNGLKPLAKIPGQFITGLTQISVAASPAFASLTSAAGGAADRISKKISDAFKSGALQDSISRAVEVAKQFGQLIGDIFGTIGNVMKAAAAGGGDALGSLGAVFAELRRITAMPEVQKALASIFQAVNAIAKLLAGTLGAVIQAALPLLAALAPVVTQLAEQFAPVLAELATTLGAALMPIITALLPVVTQIGGVIAGLVSSLLPLLKPIGDVLAAIITAIAPVISSIGAALVPLIASLAQGLAPVIQALVPAIQLVGQFLAALAPMFPSLVQALLPLIPPISQLAVALLGLAVQVLTPLMPLITGLAQLLAGVLAGAINLLVPVINVVVGAITGFVNAMTTGVKVIVDGFKWLYDVLVGHSIIPDLVKAITSWFTQLWTNTKKIFTDLKNWVVQTWKDLWNGVKTKWDTFYTGLKTSVTNAWNWLKGGLTSLKTSLTTTWNTLWNGVRDKIGGIFTTINGKITTFKNGMRTAFTTLRDSLGTIWNGVKSKISAPIKWVIDHVYNNGLRKMWNSIAGKISSSITLPAISLGFNKGGVVPGTGTSDTVPAMLTPGERILSNAQVAKLGGHKGIDAMLGQDRPTKTGGNPSRQQERQREQAGQQHYASGGIIGKVTSGIGNAVSGAYDWAKDVVVGGLKKAAQAAINNLVRPLINQIPGNGIGSLLKGLANKAVDGMLGWFGKEDKKATGGPAVQRALSWVKTQDGKKYQWAGNGNPSWDCLTLSSMITTPQGHTELRDLHPGMEVVAYQDGKLVASKVLAKWNTGEQELFKVRTRNRSIRATAGHRVLVAAPVKRPMMDVDERVAGAEWGTEWKEVRDLTPTDYLVTYTGSPKQGGEEVPEDLAWLMGLWLADGSVNQNSGIRICVYDDLAEKAMAVLRKYSPDRKVTHHPRHGVMISDVQRVRWMIRNGFHGKSHERTIPPVVMEWSQGAQDAFLKGYADGDGSYKNGKNGATFETAELIEYKATSRELIEGVREMHLRRGDRVSVTNTRVRTKDVYIGGKKIENARPVHGIEVAPGRGANQTTGAGHRPGLLRLMAQLRTESMSVQRVLSVEPDGMEETWDIEVEESHSFVSDGLISHNCSGLMSAIESVIRGERPHRRWATGAFGASAPSGWVRNLNSPFMIGITNAGVGHTAGTLAGMNVESSGGRGVHMGKSARGYNDSMFTSRWGFAPAAKYDSGGLLQPGATMAINATRKPEAVLTAEEHEAFRGIVTGLSKGGFGEGCTVNVSVELRSMTIPTEAEAKRFAKAIADPVKEEIRKLENSRKRG